MIGPVDQQEISSSLERGDVFVHFPLEGFLVWLVLRVQCKETIEARSMSAEKMGSVLEHGKEQLTELHQSPRGKLTTKELDDEKRSPLRGFEGNTSDFGIGRSSGKMAELRKETFRFWNWTIQKP